MTNTSTVLIIDDTSENAGVIASVIKDIPNCLVVQRTTARDAIQALKEKQYDILIVDIQIPLTLGDEIDKTGGMQLLQQCYLRHDLFLPTYVIGVTAHSESYDECKEFFTDSGWPLLTGTDISHRIQSIVETKIRYSPVVREHADIAIITALDKIELEAILALPCSWKVKEYPLDNNKYHLGTITLESGAIKSIVATSCSRMGMPAAAAITMKVCKKFTPETVVMTGIAAGVQGKTQLGDVLVADPCWNWGNGKLTTVNDETRFLNAPHQISLDPSYRSTFQEISRTREFLDDISNNWSPGDKPAHRLQLHVGPIASGAVVLEDQRTLEAIIAQNRDTIGIEMEGYGFAYAVSMVDYRQPKAIIIKSVCDFANTEKNDQWQAFAAYVSANIALSMLTRYYR